MTIKQFEQQKFGAGMQCKYDGATWDIASVDFQESLIGIHPPSKNEVDTDEEISWVRCENVELIEGEK